MDAGKQTIIEITASALVDYAKGIDPYEYANSYETDEEAFNEFYESLTRGNYGGIQDYILDNVEERNGEATEEESIILQAIEWL